MTKINYISRFLLQKKLDNPTLVKNGNASFYLALVISSDLKRRTYYIYTYTSSFPLINHNPIKIIKDTFSHTNIKRNVPRDIFTSSTVKLIFNHLSSLMYSIFCTFSDKIENEFHFF